MSEESNVEMMSGAVEEVEASTVETATGEAVQEESPTSEEVSTEKPKGVQKRIDELTANWRSTERDRDYWRELALKQKPEPEQSKPTPAVFQGAPKVEDYDTYDHYLIAQAKYEFKQEMEAERAAQEQSRKKAESDRITQRYIENVSSFKAKTPDFDQVVHPNLPITEAMAEVIKESDIGPQMAYHLGKNPTDASRISQLPPLKAAVELGKIEAKLRSGPKTTNAPNPINPIAQGEATSKELNDVTDINEWMERRNKQVLKQR